MFVRIDQLSTASTTGCHSMQQRNYHSLGPSSCVLSAAPPTVTASIAVKRKSDLETCERIAEESAVGPAVDDCTRATADDAGTMSHAAFLGAAGVSGSTAPTSTSSILSAAAATATSTTPSRGPALPSTAGYSTFTRRLLVARPPSWPRPMYAAPRAAARSADETAIAREAEMSESARATPGRDFYGIPNPSPGERLRLGDLRGRLIRQEETIIFALIERAQFRTNDLIYVPNAFLIPGFQGTFSQYLLSELEKVYATVRRYTSPDEHAFSPLSVLPQPLLPALCFPSTLVENDINFNADVQRVYRESIVPAICEEGDDQNYGSAAACDVACLQALSKRVHYGKFIAEAKYASDPEKYGRLARAGDRDALWALLSDANVERDLLARVENKARNYGVDVTHGGTGDVYKVEPRRIMEIYQDFIIPLTKVVEVEYLLVRYLVDELVPGDSFGAGATH
jgi:chorismate mutase